MEILLAYYTRTGYTEKLAKKIQTKLENKGNKVKVEKIELIKEPGFLITFPLDFYLMVSFFVGRLLKKDTLPRLKIKPLLYPDVSEFDRVCIVTPKWGTVPPPICEYLDKVRGMENKKIGFVGTYYSPPLPYLELEMLFGQFMRMMEEKKGTVVSMLGATTDFLESTSIKLYLSFGWIFNMMSFGKPFPKEWKNRSPYLISEKLKVEVPYGEEALESFCDKLQRG